MATAVSADRLISVSTAAARLGVDIKTARNLIANGTLPVIKLGPRLTRVDIADVDRLLTPAAATPTPAVEVPQLPTRDAFAEYIARVVEAAPPLTSDQVARLTMLLNSSTAA